LLKKFRLRVLLPENVHVGNSAVGLVVYASLLRAPNFDWVNKKELEISGYMGLGPGPYEGNTGFPVFVAPPKIVFEEKSAGAREVDVFRL
jgi:hypothetical protein